MLFIFKRESSNQLRFAKILILKIKLAVDLFGIITITYIQESLFKYLQHI